MKFHSVRERQVDVRRNDVSHSMSIIASAEEPSESCHQASKGKHEEQHLVNVVLARRKPIDQMDRPKKRVKP